MSTTGEIVTVRGYVGKWRVEQTHPGMTVLRRQGDSRMLLELVGADRERIEIRRPVILRAPRAPRRRKAVAA